MPDREVAVMVAVRGNNVESALRALKRQVSRSGLLKEMRSKQFYEKPSVKRRRKQKEARKRRAKSLKNRRYESPK